jgi:hypothetical protein
LAQPRRLNLDDAIVLVAMTAVGFGLSRPVISHSLSLFEHATAKLSFICPPTCR